VAAETSRDAPPARLRMREVMAATPMIEIMMTKTMIAMIMPVMIVMAVVR
jgi:hypothetical protein